MSKIAKQFTTAQVEREREEIQKEITEKQHLEDERKQKFQEKFNVSLGDPKNSRGGENR